jgi:hypothetical protein
MCVLYMCLWHAIMCIVIGSQYLNIYLQNNIMMFLSWSAHVPAREPTSAPRRITWRKQSWQNCESAPEFNVKYPQLYS